MATVLFQDKRYELAGELPAEGSRAPGFRLTDGALKDRTLADFSGQIKILNIVPSLDTKVCEISAGKFRAQCDQLPNTVALHISMDLPFAQARCKAAGGSTNSIPLSAFRHPEFGLTYGVRISCGPLEGLLSRSVLVIGPDDFVVFSQLVPAIEQEPDYEAALAAARRIIAG
ncbi:MAG: thiol peroxidase [Kiritimatiellae bacterium]|nr:thiol peroxidase [Kiritimatiellia bacterium]